MPRTVECAAIQENESTGNRMKINVLKIRERYRSKIKKAVSSDESVNSEKNGTEITLEKYNIPNDNDVDLLGLPLIKYPQIQFFTNFHRSTINIPQLSVDISVINT